MKNKTNLYVIFVAILLICCVIFFPKKDLGSILKTQVADINSVTLHKNNSDLFIDKLYSLISKMIEAKSFSQKEETFYFGKEGINNLGRSLSKYKKHCTQNKCNMLGQMIIDKISPLLSGYDVYEYSFGNANVVGCTDGTLRGGGGHGVLTVIFRDTNHKKEDLCLIFNLYIPQDEPDNFYIRLHLSYLNGIPLWKILGFSRHERIWGEFYPPKNI